MLFLAFRIGGEAMALAAGHIVEIVPLVDLEQPRQGSFGTCATAHVQRGTSPLPRPATHRILPLGGRAGERAGAAHSALPNVQTATQGVFQYRGQYIPAIDLSLRDTGQPARRRMSTRIVVIRSPWDEAQLVGLIAEGASAMLRFDPADFAPFAQGPDGLVQRVEPRDLVPQEVLI